MSKLRAYWIEVFLAIRLDELARRLDPRSDRKR